MVMGSPMFHYHYLLLNPVGTVGLSRGTGMTMQQWFWLTVTGGLTGVYSTNRDDKEILSGPT